MALSTRQLLRVEIPLGIKTQAIALIGLSCLWHGCLGFEAFHGWQKGSMSGRLRDLCDVAVFVLPFLLMLWCPFFVAEVLRRKTLNIFDQIFYVLGITAVLSVLFLGHLVFIP